MNTDAAVDFAVGLAHLPYDMIEPNIHLALLGPLSGQIMSPGIRIRDPAGVYRAPYVRIRGPAMEPAAVGVTAWMLSNWGVDADDIMTAAAANDDTEALVLPALVENEDGLPNVYRIGNGVNYLGAGVLFTPKAQDTLKRLCPRGYLIMPASIHHMLCISCPSHKQAQMLQRILHEANETAKRLPITPAICDDILIYHNNKLVTAKI